jgi:hypothetical protein
MSGRQAKAARRMAKKVITEDLHKVCQDFMDAMCMLPFRRRWSLACKIVRGK